MTNERNNPTRVFVDSLDDAIHEARVDDSELNGMTASRTYVVEWPSFNVSVTYRHTFERGSYFLLKVQPFGDVDPRDDDVLMGRIHKALGYTEYDMSLELQESDGRYTAILPTDIPFN